MNEIEACKDASANYLYITNPLWKHAQRISSSPHNLLFVTEGVLYIEMQDTRYTVNPGECLYLPRGVPSIGYRPSTTPTGFFFARFKTNKPFPLPTHFAVTNATLVRELYMHLVRSYYNPDYPQAGLDAMLHALLYTLYYQLNHVEEKKDNSLAAKIKDYLDSTVYRNLTVADVAAHFGFCPNYVNRVFFRAEHMTIKTYTNLLKINRIEELLVSFNTPVNVIAQKLNFPTPSALSKYYKYHTGHTPEEFRAKFLDLK